MLLPNVPPGETAEVRLFYLLGMTEYQSRQFCCVLNDHPIAGFNAPKLAKYVFRALAREQYFGDKARAACEQMIAQSRERPEPLFWPRD
jgi:hypothetical protein